MPKWMIFLFPLVIIVPLFFIVLICVYNKHLPKITCTIFKLHLPPTKFWQCDSQEDAGWEGKCPRCGKLLEHEGGNFWSEK